MDELEGMIEREESWLEEEEQTGVGSETD